jgi:hypothetical protein
LARADAIPTLIENLTAEYYQPCARRPSILLCKPVSGSSVLLMQ